MRYGAPPQPVRAVNGYDLSSPAVIRVVRVYSAAVLKTTASSRSTRSSSAAIVGASPAVPTIAARTRSVGRVAASVNAADLIVDNLTLNWESAGDGSFSAKRTAKVTSIGTGNVTVSGKPACTVTNGGNGQVSCGSTPAQ